MSDTSTDIHFKTHYKIICAKRSADELHMLSHIKRFLELFVGDAGVRSLLSETPDLARNIAKDHNLDLDPQDLFPIWGRGFRSKISSEDLEAFPLLKLWSGWMKDLIRMRELITRAGHESSSNLFAKWRHRQIKRCITELGDADQHITHPVASFELTSGCSVGCWFCGLRAKKLEKIFRYTEANAQLWRDVLEVLSRELGPAIETSFCYWATEPSDNPDYVDFLLDLQKVTGVIPQTTTAKPLRNIDWTRRILEISKIGECIPPRFSVTSHAELSQIHHQFSPEELFFVELVQQHDQSLIIKANAGRAKDNNLRGPAELDGNPLRDLGTIACLTGFLLNMPEHTIKLITPCRASDKWPLGYQVLAEGTFTNGNEVENFLQNTIATHMPLHLESDMVLGIRDDIQLETIANGFRLAGPFTRMKMQGRSYLEVLGTSLASGSMTTAEIIQSGIRAGATIFSVTADLQNLFDQGYIDQQPRSGAIRKDV